MYMNVFDGSIQLILKYITQLAIVGLGILLLVFKSNIEPTNIGSDYPVQVVLTLGGNSLILQTSEYLTNFYFLFLFLMVHVHVHVECEFIFLKER